MYLFAYFVKDIFIIIKSSVLKRGSILLTDEMING